MPGPPSKDLCKAGAFTELCHNSLPYLSDSGGPAPFDIDNLSLPATCVSPVDPLEHLSAEHREQVIGANSNILRSESAAQAT